MITGNTALVEVTNLEDIIAAAKIMSQEDIPELLDFAKRIEIQRHTSMSRIAHP